MATGHSLSYHNFRRIAMIPEVSEPNIWHAIISSALMVGLASAVKKMKDLILDASVIGQLAKN